MFGVDRCVSSIHADHVVGHRFAVNDHRDHLVVETIRREFSTKNPFESFDWNRFSP
jgi:hypothetical protein